MDNISKYYYRISDAIKLNSDPNTGSIFNIFFYRDTNEVKVCENGIELTNFTVNNSEELESLILRSRSFLFSCLNIIGCGKSTKINLKNTFWIQIRNLKNIEEGRNIPERKILEENTLHQYDDHTMRLIAS